MKRKTGMRRIAAYLLALVFLFALLPAAGAESPAEEPSNEETLADIMAERFGYDAVVETDENGEPVMVPVENPEPAPEEGAAPEEAPAEAPAEPAPAEPAPVE